MIVLAGSTISFRIPSRGLRDWINFAETDNRLALHPQKHKGHQERATYRGGQPSRKDAQSNVTPASHGMSIPPSSQKRQATQTSWRRLEEIGPRRHQAW